eukprot:6189695-Pleurochrysis_carterae.AAC.2
MCTLTRASSYAQGRAHSVDNDGRRHRFADSIDMRSSANAMYDTDATHEIAAAFTRTTLPTNGRTSQGHEQKSGWGRRYRHTQ